MVVRCQRKRQARIENSTSKLPFMKNQDEYVGTWHSNAEMTRLTEEIAKLQRLNVALVDKDVVYLEEIERLREELLKMGIKLASRDEIIKEFIHYSAYVMNEKLIQRAREALS